MTISAKADVRASVHAVDRYRLRIARLDRQAAMQAVVERCRTAIRLGAVRIRTAGEVYILAGETVVTAYVDEGTVASRRQRAVKRERAALHRAERRDVD